MSRLSAFMNKLIDFLDDLKLTFPELLEISTAHKQLDTWGDGAAVKKITAENFMYCCAPFYKQIFHEKEDFFKNPDNIQKAEGFKKFGGNTETEQQNTISQMLQFKDYWDNLTSTNQNRIWKHMKALLVNGAAALIKNNPEYQVILVYVKKHPELYK